MAMMTIQQFRLAVKERAGDQFYSARVCVSEHHDGELRIECDAYLHNVGWTGRYPTPEEALTELDIRLAAREQLSKPNDDATIEELGAPA